MNWQPSANMDVLRKRADVIANIRLFFKERDVLEVETPLLAYTSIPDPQIQSIEAFYQSYGEKEKITYYLQTSPEFAMKRLLAAGAGSIYQICKAFRNGDVGRFHNPEFTMLEWYRVGFNLQQLMHEVDELLQGILNTKPAQYTSYQNLFLNHLAIDPLTASIKQLTDTAKNHQINMVGELDKDGWLQCLMSHVIEPKLGFEYPVVVYDFPASQAALARTNPKDNRVAERFEIYVNGLELANGFNELTMASEQRMRFQENLVVRKQLGLPLLPLDEKFLAALEVGLPQCSGVALGVDRLIMLALGANSLSEIMAFDFARV